jgi:hypothetical protein
MDGAAAFCGSIDAVDANKNVCDYSASGFTHYKEAIMDGTSKQEKYTGFLSTSLIKLSNKASFLLSYSSKVWKTEKMIHNIYFLVRLVGLPDFLSSLETDAGAKAL